MKTTDTAEDGTAGKKRKGKPGAKDTPKPTAFKSVHAEEPKREVVWSERRVKVLYWGGHGPHHP